ncbi:MAG: hypothetical protein MUE48_02875 [Desulfobacterales bacterium]|jgi:hypothetical protein|nr:hypothetical protein [Desulfobacterales bacterium]
MELLGPIRVELDVDTVQKKLHAPERRDVEAMVAQALSLAQPRAAFAAAYIDQKGEDEVVVSGRRFRSRVLRKNLDDVGRIFPVVLTAGPQLEQAADSADMLARYYLDAIANLILAEARQHLIRHLCKRFGVERLAWMSPGSLQDWPLEQQRPLFALLPGVEDRLGVRLTDSCLMLPRKSVSGIYFPSESSFFSCRLCPRERCESRKARYDKSLVKEYGIEH